MKIGKLFLCVIASAALLAGCEEKPGSNETPSISVSPESIEEFAVEGGDIDGIVVI